MGWIGRSKENSLAQVGNSMCSEEVWRLGFLRYWALQQSNVGQTSLEIVEGFVFVGESGVERPIFPVMLYILEACENRYASCLWKGLCWGWELLMKGLWRSIGNGRSALIYRDPWALRPSSFQIFTKRAEGDCSAIADFITPNKTWEIICETLAYWCWNFEDSY